jgi:hypothetical protein
MDTTMSKARKYSLKPEDVKHYLVQDRLPNSYLMASRPDDEARIVADVKRRMMGRRSRTGRDSNARQRALCQLPYYHQRTGQ